MRIRLLQEEFTHPDEIAPGANLTMNYLADYEAYQSYLDGKLDVLFARQRGNLKDQDMTGWKFYVGSTMAGLWKVNYFQSVLRFVRQSVFERHPTVIGGEESVVDQWKEDSREILRQCRQGLDWLTAKGRAVFVVEHKISRGEVVPVFTAKDPAGYLPILLRTDRQVIIGHAFCNWWSSLGRMVGSNRADRVDITIIITEEDAAKSDGLVKPMNEIRTFTWNTENAAPAHLGSLLEVRSPSRVQAVWTIGDDDSTFASMESTSYHANLFLNHSRTALTQDVRSIVILPGMFDAENIGEDGQFVFPDPLNPTVRIPTNMVDSATMYGFVESPGPAKSSAYMDMHGLTMEQLAYDAGLPQEAVGEGYMANESGEAVKTIRSPFITRIVDVQDDFSHMLREAWPLLGGPEGAILGWEHQPGVNQEMLDDRAIKLKGAGLISRATGQAMCDVPIEEVTEATPNDSQDGGNDDARNQPTGEPPAEGDVD